jgi:hypothetical protein
MNLSILVNKILNKMWINTAAKTIGSNVKR